jgi:hypothetical protein
MIVRLMGRGQWRLDHALIDELNRIDAALDDDINRGMQPSSGSTSRRCTG